MDLRLRDCSGLARPSSTSEFKKGKELCEMQFCGVRVEGGNEGSLERMKELSEGCRRIEDFALRSRG